MKYVCQIFTGGFKNTLYSSSDIIEKLEEIEKKIMIEKVIIGWNLEGRQYKVVREYLSKKEIKMYLWLPVFSETGALKEMKQAIDLWGNEVENFSHKEGENFEFYCPSNKKNIENIIDIYEKYFEEVGFDGVFLDKIRSQSFVSGCEGVLSCCCEECEKKFRERGVDLETFRTFVEKVTQEKTFMIKSFSFEKGFRFSYENVEKYIDAKEDLYYEGVYRIASRFKQKGLEIGMDVFYPAMAPYVGQNISKLLNDADFIKPMMYRRTKAPAGIGFEYNKMLESLKGDYSYNKYVKKEEFDSLSKEHMKLQLRRLVLNNGKHKVYAGIEVNNEKDVVKSDEEYVISSVEAAEEAGCEGVVLSWNVMDAPIENITILKKVKKVSDE